MSFFGKLRTRVGRRGAALLFFALLDIVYSYSLLYPSASARNSNSFVFLESILPLWLWGGMWGFVGVICLTSAFLRSDRLGFTSAICIKVIWGTIYVAAQIVGGVERGYVSAAIWLSLAAFVALISSWPEPPEEGPLWKVKS